jgi:hypothetical protein
MRHPKCKGSSSESSWGTEHDFGYRTSIACDDCRYCLDEDGKPVGRKDPAAKCNKLDR